MNSKYQKLLSLLKSHHKLAVAFSGGVDSTFLLYAAREALGDNVIALSIVTPYVPQWEQEEAMEIARQLKVQRRVVSLSFPEELRNNPSDHCYTCKKILFSKLLELAKAEGCEAVVDGTNVDDLSDYRPGLVALKELSISSPMVEAGLTKDEIRQLSKEFNLPTWDKPSFACLLSRLPVGVRVEEADFVQIEKAERFLMASGFAAVRLRHHGDVARIEVPKQDIVRLIECNRDGKIDNALKSMGYRHVAVDLAGYTMGSLNRPVGEEDE